MSEARTRIAVLLGNKKLLNTVVAGLIVAFGVLYIAQVNAAASKGLALRALEERNDALRVEVQMTAAKIDELRSLDSVMQREQLLGLVKAERVSYVSVPSGAVALR
ncbi:hypothetical protein HYS28_02675 [Candidatus Uhrbacteria bacterium]|nr:hypothetical protein [Candidatus Uhrbacteria bacterium]